MRGFARGESVSPRSVRGLTSRSKFQIPGFNSGLRGTLLRVIATRHRADLEFGTWNLKRWSRAPAPLAPGVQALANLGFVATINRFLVAALRGQIILIDPAIGRIVAVLIAGMAECLRDELQAHAARCES